MQKKLIERKSNFWASFVYRISQMGVFLFLCISCKQKEEPFPVNITSEGAIASVGKINIQFEAPGMLNEYPAKAIFEYGGISIVNTPDKKGETLILSVNGKQPGVYGLGSYYTSYSFYRNIESDRNYDSDGYSSSTGKIVISEIDEIKKTISGSYEYLGYYVNNSDLKFIMGSFNQIPYSVSSVQFKNSMSAMVSKIETSRKFEGKSVSANYVYPYITIEGKGAGNESMILKIKRDISVNYDTSLGGDNSGSYIDEKGEEYRSYNAYSSNIKITSHDRSKRLISGNFRFRHVGNEISEGNFSVNY